MKTLKKVLALLLTVLLVFSIVACGADSSSDSDTKGSQTSSDTSSDTNASDTEKDSQSDSSSESEKSEETTREDILKAYDFDGETVTILGRSIGYEFTAAPESQGDTIVMSLWYRYNNIQDALNVVVDQVLSEDNYANRVMADVESNTNDYDIYDAHMKFGAYLGSGGYNKNLRKIDNLDLTQDYWNPNYTNNFTYKNYTFWTTGDIDNGFIGQNVAMYINDDIYVGAFGGTIDDVFALVEEGKWTLEKMTSMVETVGVNNIDDNPSVTAGDSFGWIYENTGWVVASIAYGAGYKMTTLEGNKYALTLSTPENELVYDACLKALQTNGAQGDFGNGNNKAEFIFTDGRALFYHGRLSNVVSPIFKDMKAYSILPMPKFAEEYNYVTPSYDGVPIYGVLQSLPESRYAVVGAVLDAEGYYGKELCTEAYYQIALRAKYAKNEGSYRTIAIVRESAWADFAFSWTGPLGEIDYFLSDNLRGGSSLSTAAAISSSKYNDLLSKLYTSMGKVIKANP